MMTGRFGAFAAFGLAVLAVVIIAGAAGSLPSQAAVDPPPPEQLPATGIGWRDQVYYGATPPGSEAMPVLVFVHGIGGLAEDWFGPINIYGVNDMYVTAYNAGYRTAFVTLNEDGQRWPVRSMWANGLTLALQIDAIAGQYGVNTVDIVAHSKGGVDAQAAVVYWGAAPRVRNVFTLSAPHRGSEIADLGFDTALGRVLLRLLGMQDDGIQYMTTRFMGLFRALTDMRPDDDAVNYYWAAGTDWQVPASGIWFSGWYLENNFGPNDGLVTVARAELPGNNSTQLFIEPFDHYEISTGSASFPYIDAIASGAALAPSAVVPR